MCSEINVADCVSESTDKSIHLFNFIKSSLVMLLPTRSVFWVKFNTNSINVMAFDHQSLSFIEFYMRQKYPNIVAGGHETYLR